MSTFPLQLPFWGNAAGWGVPPYYTTIHVADIDGDGADELLIRGPSNLIVHRFASNTRQWMIEPLGPSLSDAEGWNQPEYFSTIQYADVDGDGAMELIARGASGILVWDYDPKHARWSFITSDLMSDAQDWNQPQYYETIHCADIDGDGQAEILGRGSDGVIAAHFDKTTLTWEGIGSTLSDFSDLNGWNNPNLYPTIQFADIDGDQQDELLAHGLNGEVAYKYDKGSGTWTQLATITQIASPNWVLPQYYETIHCADIDNDQQAEVLARDSSGIRVFHYEKATGSWLELPSGPPLSDQDGWNLPFYYQTIQYYDIDGDGQAELLARSPAGMVAYHFEKNSQTWTQMPDGPAFSDSSGWIVPSSYLTIQCLQFAPGAEGLPRSTGLLGRGPNTVSTFSFSPADASWALANRDSVSFPRVPEPQKEAFTYISRQLDGSNNIRDAYGNETAIDTYVTALDNLGRPGHIPEADWDPVRKELSFELGLIQAVDKWFDYAGGLITDTFSSDGIDISAIVNIIDAASSTVDTNLFSAVATAAAAILGISNPVAAMAAGMLSAAFSAAASSGGLTLQTVGDQLAEDAVYQFGLMKKANGNTLKAVVQDWGLLRAYGVPIKDNILVWNQETQAQLLIAAQNAYTLWLWQLLMPLRWTICYKSISDCQNPHGPGCPPAMYPSNYAYNDGSYIYWIQGTGFADFPSDECLAGLFTSGIGCLNVPLPVFFTGQAGWSLPRNHE
jgi:hypothetical protein